MDTLVVVVPSPNGGQPMQLPPPFTGTASFFAWPMASGGTFMWGRWGPFPTIYSSSWKPFKLVVMPAEWNTLRTPNGVLTTLTHELGHTLGMGDLYLTPVRDVEGRVLLAAERPRSPAGDLRAAHVADSLDVQRPGQGVQRGEVLGDRRR